MMEGQHTLSEVLVFGEKLLLIGLSITLMVIFFLSGMSLSTLLPLNPAIYSTI